MRVCAVVCLTMLSLMVKHQQASLSLNVDQAREELSARHRRTYSQMHEPTDRGDRALAEEADDEKEDADEDGMASILDEADEAEDRKGLDVEEEDEKLSFLEDLDSADLDEEYDMDAMDDDDARVIADSMQGEERTAFLQRWEAHKANRRINGDPDPYGSFTEI